VIQTIITSTYYTDVIGAKASKFQLNMAAKKTFNGQSGTSIEEAIKNAIETDPKVDPGTDIFNYEVVKLKVDFGGFTAATTYRVVLERP
jgi:flavin-binding protein dodecin